MKNNKSSLTAYLLFTLLAGVFCSCGRNFLSSSAPTDKKESAEKLMEADKYGEAQIELEALLISEPQNYEARSMLGACLAAQGGVSLVKLILKAASAKASGNSSGSSGSSTGTSSSNPLAGILPTTTLANIAFMRNANAQMALIPTASLNESMKTQTSAFLLFESLMFLEYLSKNPSALASLSEADALKVIKNIAKSASVLGSGAASKNPFATVAAEKAKALETAPGSTSQEKLGTLL